MHQQLQVIVFADAYDRAGDVIYKAGYIAPMSGSTIHPRR